jgi:hypothetical protein
MRQMSEPGQRGMMGTVSMRWVCLIVIPLALASNLCAADPIEASLRARIDRLPPPEKAFLGNAVYAGQYPLDQLVTFSTRQERLVATFHLPVELERQFRDPAPLLISLQGSDHIWSVHRRKGGTLDKGLSLIVLTCYAPADRGPFNRYTLSSDGHNLMVAAAQMFGHPATQENIALSQGERSLHLLWRLQLDKWSVHSVDLAALSQIPARAPGLLENYLLPVLRRLGPAQPASDVYRVFDQIPADPKVVKKVWPVLEKLDASDARDRDAAFTELQRMGRQAVLACLRLDVTTLSAEQRNRLTALYACEGWAHVPDVDAARSDPVFLSACLDDPDPTVRSTASNLLAALRAVPPAP